MLYNVITRAINTDVFCCTTVLPYDVLFACLYQAWPLPIPKKSVSKKDPQWPVRPVVGGWLVKRAVGDGQSDRWYGIWLVRPVVPNDQSDWWVEDWCWGLTNQISDTKISKVTGWLVETILGTDETSSWEKTGEPMLGHDQWNMFINWNSWIRLASQI